MATTATSTPTTTPAAGRVVLLDVLRGVAILGTLATNVWIFATPGGEARFLLDATSVSAAVGLSGDRPAAAAIVEGVFRFLANGKFLALLTILFGVGLAIQHRSATTRGRPWPGRYGWRALLLFVEGTLHFLLVFAFDVLMGYAVTAMLVAWLLARSVRVQRAAMYLAGGVHLALMGLLTLALVLAPQTVSGDGGAGTEPQFTEAGWPAQVAFRLDNLLALRAEPILTFGLLVFLFLFGVRLWRAGVFDADDRGRVRRRRLLWIGLGVGLPLNAATTLAGPQWFLFDRYVSAPLLALGYLGLVGLWVDGARRPGVVRDGLGAVGRTALSCYVLQNVLCAALCYGWGLGLAHAWRQAAPWWVLGLWAALSVVLVVVARWWTTRWRRGPLEAAAGRLVRRS
ncbi:DUF418 domain-containing protein [Micromonospora sp. SH-82]|uniref:DUF418 domain-containing protein n=1 Tax=Micromonospora sp. SH-82 TaxID=3132938 RepID=UPI003EB7907E